MTEAEDRDLVPTRRRGRPTRSFAGVKPFEAGRSTSRTPRCRECPKHNSRTRWCPVSAAPKTGMEPACRYGVVLMRAARLAARREGLG